MSKTKIEWVKNPDGTRGGTWNPVTGCTPISEGCRNCYAKRMARRLAGRHGYPPAPHHFDVTLRPERLEQPLERKKPTTYFVCSMADLFHKDVPFVFVLEVWRVMMEANHHTFLILTKHPQRMFDFLRVATDNLDTYPVILPNVHLGVTAENQKAADERIPILLQIPAAVRFVSVEPMLGEIDLNRPYWIMSYGDEGPGENDTFLRQLDWIIVGAETGPGARPMHPDWARSVRDQCVTAGVPFFFKRDSDGSRLLDGQLWEQMPETGLD